MDKALKQRLVGASVLIILAVIVLPMLLSGRSDRLKHESNRIELPPKPDELSIETRRFPVGVPSRPVPAAEQKSVEDKEPDNQEQTQTDSIDIASATTEKPVNVPQIATGGDETQMPGSESDDMQTTLIEPAETTTPTVTPIILKSGKEESLEVSQVVEGSGDTPRYLVQVASFSNERNANALADLLKVENLPVLLDVVDRPAGRMYRVRVGPYANRSDADALVANLRTKMKDLTPRVLDLRPDESAPVSTPSDPLVRWVVQVGSFSNLKSADDLVAKLRLAGLSAFSEKVTSTTGTVYKVRIGPELNREKAAELARKIKAEQQLDTFVTTQE